MAYLNLSQDIRASETIKEPIVDFGLLERLAVKNSVSHSYRR
jgi:hypothetical protein